MTADPDARPVPGSVRLTPPHGTVSSFGTLTSATSYDAWANPETSDGLAEEERMADVSRLVTEPPPEGEHASPESESA